MSSPQIDQSGWEPIRRKAKLAHLALVFVAGFVVLWVYQGFIALFESRFLYVAFYLSASVASAAVLGVVAALQLLRRRQRPRHVRWPSGGVILTTSGGVRVQTALMVKVVQGLSHGVGAGACAVFSYGMWSGRLSFPMSPGQAKVFPFVAIVLGASAVAILVWFALGLARFPFIEVTPTCLVVVTYVARQVIAWSDVISVDAVTLGNHAGIEVKLAESARAEVEVFYRGPCAPSQRHLRRTVAFTADIMATGAAPLLAFLQYYAADPAARQELGDGRAYQRLVDGVVD